MKSNKAEMKRIQDEIDWYQPSAALSKTMLELGKLGFSFGGHGTDMTTGEEDFSFDKSMAGIENIEVNLHRKYCRIYATLNDDDNFYASSKKSPKSVVTLARKLKNKSTIEQMIKKEQFKPMEFD